MCRLIGKDDINTLSKRKEWQDKDIRYQKQKAEIDQRIDSIPWI